MSSKKNNLNLKDNQYMGYALRLAELHKGLTAENPSVGCIIVKNDCVISVGKTGINGRPHAEFNAIKKTKKNLNGSTMYVTMEPCNHYGKTPPCTKIISESKIKKVVYSINDIDIRSRNKAIKFLKSKKINVKKGVLDKEVFNFYKSYFFIKKYKIPYVIGKIACSKDNLINSKYNKYITNDHLLKISHLLRYRNQGILVSYRTINSDNPMLNCRLNGLDKFSPKRFILDKNLKIKKKSKLVNSAKKIPTYIFYNCNNNRKINYLKKNKLKLIKIDLDNNNYLDFQKILKCIYKLKIYTLLIEGGYKLTNYLLKKKFFNEFYLFKSNKKLGKKGYNNISNAINKLIKLYNKNEILDTFTNEDKIIRYF